MLRRYPPSSEVDVFPLCHKQESQSARKAPSLGSAASGPELNWILPEKEVATLVMFPAHLKQSRLAGPALPAFPSIILSPRTRGQNLRLRVICAIVKHHDQNQGREERVYLTSTCLFITEEDKTGTQTGQEPGGRS